MSAPRIVSLDPQAAQPAQLVVFCLHHESRHGDALEGVCATLALAQALAQGQSATTLAWRASEAPTAGRMGQLMKDTRAVQAAQARYEQLGPIWSAEEPDGPPGLGLVATWSIVPTLVMRCWYCTRCFHLTRQLEVGWVGDGDADGSGHDPAPGVE